MLLCIPTTDNKLHNNINMSKQLTEKKKKNFGIEFSLLFRLNLCAA